MKQKLFSASRFFMPLAVFALFSFKSSAVETLDQTFTPIPAGMSSITGSSKGQSFTCGLTGNLTKVVIDIRDQSPTASSSDVRLRILAGAGTDPICAGAILSDQTDLNITENQQYTFTLPTPIAVVAGNVYTLRFITTDGSICNAAFTGGSAYAGGDYYSGVTCVPFASTTDHWFQTWVDVAGPVVPNTKVIASQCAAVNLPLNQVVYCDAVPGATNYRWSFKNLTTNVTKEYTRNDTKNTIQLNWVQGMAYATNYEVTVKAYQGGTWGNYNVACTLGTAAIQTSQLSPTFCNQTNITPTGNLGATYVIGATQYEFNIVGGVINRSWFNTKNYIPFSWISGLAYNTTYTVKIKITINGVAGAYGTSCTFSTPSTTPTTQLSMQYCESSGNSMSVFYCDAVVLAQDYKYRFTNTNDMSVKYYVRGKPQNNITLGQVSFLVPNTVYLVSVETKIGGVWGTSFAGMECPVYYYGGQFKTSPELMLSETEGITTVGDNLMVYPNPSQGQDINLTLNTIENGYGQVQVNIYDVVGKRVHAESVYMTEGVPAAISATELTTGVYFMNATINGVTHKTKLAVGRE